MRCDHCGRQVPEGVFCTICGAHQTTALGVGDEKDRTHRYAAHPGEHVANPNVFTTIFPHLASHRVHEFRYAFLGGVAVLAILYGFGLIVAGLLVSAILVPVLYLIYLYEVQVYRDEPALVVGVTMGLGLLLGVVVTVVTNNLLKPHVLLTGGLGGSGGYATTGDFLEGVVLVPALQLLFVSLPALLLRSRPAFGETADGLVLGVAAGLGYSAAETVVRFSDAIVNTQLRSTPGTWIFPLLSTCIFIPLLHGTGAGLIAASVWPRRRTQRSAGLARLAVVAALVLTLAFFVVGEWITESGTSQLLVLGWQAVMVGLMVVYLRYLLHFALLDEAEDLGFSPQLCSNCHKHVMAAGFCPACGLALSSGPRRAIVSSVDDAAAEPEAAAEPVAAPAATATAAAVRPRSRSRAKPKPKPETDSDEPSVDSASEDQ
jgi:hypothetical protein